MKNQQKKLHLHLIVSLNTWFFYYKGKLYINKHPEELVTAFLKMVYPMTILSTPLSLTMQRTYRNPFWETFVMKPDGLVARW